MLLFKTYSLYLLPLLIGVYIYTAVAVVRGTLIQWPDVRQL